MERAGMKCILGWMKGVLDSAIDWFELFPLARLLEDLIPPFYFSNFEHAKVFTNGRPHAFCFYFFIYALSILFFNLWFVCFCLLC